MHAGERVFGQNFDCHAVRSGLKRGVFMNWEDGLAQTTGYKGKSVRRQRRWQQQQQQQREAGVAEGPPESGGGGNGSATTAGT